MALELEKMRLLAVEGEDDKALFEALLQSEAITSVQVHAYGGVSSLPRFVKGLEAVARVDELEALGIVRDADEDAQNTWRSLTDMPRRGPWAVPPRSGGGRAIDRGSRRSSFRMATARARWRRCC